MFRSAARFGRFGRLCGVDDDDDDDEVRDSSYSTRPDLASPQELVFVSRENITGELQTREHRVYRCLDG